MLRTHPFRESSLVVVVFSGEEGKVRGVARSARRPGSRLGSALDSGNEVRAVWFEREGRPLVNFDRAELVCSALPLVRDPLRGAALASFLELLDLFAAEREANPDLYRLMAACRSALLEEAPPPLIVAYFEAWILRLSGFYPRPSRCACGAGFAEAGAHYFAGGPVWRCPRCRPEADPPTATLPGSAIGLLEDIWRLPPDRIGDRRDGDRQDGALALFRFHGFLTGAVAERRLPSREGLSGLFAARVFA